MKTLSLNYSKGYNPDLDIFGFSKRSSFHVWKSQQAEAEKTTQALRTRIDKILDRKIDNQTYQTQLGILREEQALAQMELNEARVDELDIETVVNFAIDAIRDASRCWMDATIDQKQRFQQVLFPEGLAFDGKKFGTATTCLALSYLQQVSAGQPSLASRTGVEPVSRP